jgi:chitinase
MFKNVLSAAVAVLLLAGCNMGNLGFYLYPQAASTGIAEVKTSGPLAGLEVVGYLPAYKIAKIPASQTRHLTDLVYFTLGVHSDASVAHGVLTASHRDFLRNVKRDYGVRILMGVTDHSQSGNLAAVAASPELRTRFALNLTEFLVTEGFDGADFDWEYPTNGQMDGYAELLTAVKAQFGPRNLRLSVAISPGKPLSAQGFAAVDRVHGMLYDDDGRHSTLENTAEHVRQLLAEGVAPSQLLLGVPFYGRGYTRSGPAWSSAVSYKTLRERYDVDPTQDTVSGYYFNGSQTVRRKVEFAKAAGLSGVMIWEIGQDTTDDASLLAAITQARRDLERVN